MNITAQDLDVAAKTVVGEARGETLLGQQAVAHVILNRAEKKGSGLANVCLARWQFSCWNEGDPNRALIEKLTPADPAYQDAMYVMLGALRGHLSDPTAGSRHYHTPSVSPSWAAGKTAVAHIGGHLFFNDVA